MTVRELIEILSKLDGNLKVVVDDERGGAFRPATVFVWEDGSGVCIDYDSEREETWNIEPLSTG